MKVLHINVRMQEGGAARIALDLHCNLTNRGIESKLAYGWGEKGGQSSFEKEVPNCFQIGNRYQVATNILFNRITGIDKILPSFSKQTHLRSEIEWADVIHLHVIHSYFLPIQWIATELSIFKKPIIWTAHDYWMLTGRCAFTEGCIKWQFGCGHCPTLNNYPPSLLDFSSSQFSKKRMMINKFSNNLRVVAPTSFVASEITSGFPNLNVNVIPNWIDQDFELAARNLPDNKLAISLKKDKIRVLVTANDLSDPSKVDKSLIGELAKFSHIEIHTIGHNSPFKQANIVNHGRVLNRSKMVGIVSSTDVALFTSKKDTFGLVMIEALSCGVPVIAVESLAAIEVLNALGLSPICDFSTIIKLLSDSKLPACYEGKSRSELSRTTMNKFNRKLSIESYIDVYNQSLTI